MSGYVSFLSLSYLIEVSIIANIAYNELIYARFSDHLGDNLDEFRADLKSKFNKVDLDVKERVDELIKEAVEHLKNVLYGIDIRLWEIEKKEKLQRFFRDWLIKHRATKWTFNFIVADVIILTLCTLFEPVEVGNPWLIFCDGNVWTNFQDFFPKVIWLILLLYVVSSIFLPIWLRVEGKKCYEFLFGPPGYDGAVNTLKNEETSRIFKEAGIRKGEVTTMLGEAREVKNILTQEEDGGDAQ